MEIPSRILATASTIAMLGAPAIARAQTIDTTPVTTGPTPEEQFDFCVEEAFGAADKADLATLNPAEAVDSRYVGRSVRRFAVGLVANAVSTDCKDIIHSRVVKVDQIYKGKVNTPHSIVFNGLGAMTGEQRTAVTLTAPFTPIRGPKVRAYTISAKETVVTTQGTFLKEGTVTVRGSSDGR